MRSTNVSAYDVRGDVDLDGDVDSADKSTLISSYEGASLGHRDLSDVANRKGFAGYEIDSSLGATWHVRSRVLSSVQGRWSRRDPLGYVDGNSLYEYVSGQAIAASDPLGLSSCEKGGTPPLGFPLYNDYPPVPDPGYACIGPTPPGWHWVYEGVCWDKKDAEWRDDYAKLYDVHCNDYQLAVNDGSVNKKIKNPHQAAKAKDQCEKKYLACLLGTAASSSGVSGALGGDDAPTTLGKLNKCTSIKNKCLDDAEQTVGEEIIDDFETLLGKFASTMMDSMADCCIMVEWADDPFFGGSSPGGTAGTPPFGPPPPPDRR